MLTKLRTRKNDLERVEQNWDKIQYLEQWYGLAGVIAVMMIWISWEYVLFISAGVFNGFSFIEGAWPTLVLFVHMRLFDATVLFCGFKWKEGKDSLSFWTLMMVFAKTGWFFCWFFIAFGLLGMIIGLFNGSW